MIILKTLLAFQSDTVKIVLNFTNYDILVLTMMLSAIKI